MFIAEALLVGVMLGAALLAWRTLARVLTDALHRERPAIGITQIPGAPSLQRPGHTSAMERRLHTELRLAVSRLSSRADSLDDRLRASQQETAYLRQEARSAEAARTAQSDNLASEIHQLQAAARVTAAQLDELEREMKRRVITLAEVRRLDELRARKERESDLLRAIDEVLADAAGGLAHPAEARLLGPPEVQ